MLNYFAKMILKYGIWKFWIWDFSKSHKPFTLQSDQVLINILINIMVKSLKIRLSPYHQLYRSDNFLGRCSGRIICILESNYHIKFIPYERVATGKRYMKKSMRTSTQICHIISLELSFCICTFSLYVHLTTNFMPILIHKN